MGRRLEGEDDSGPLVAAAREAVCRAAVTAGVQRLAAGRKGGAGAGRQRE
jgi:hypothetical protein